MEEPLSRAQIEQLVQLRLHTLTNIREGYEAKHKAEEIIQENKKMLAGIDYILKVEGIE